jgi:hypothetical protein
VGQSSTVTPGLNNTTTGLSLTNNGYIFASKADDNVAWFNRNTSDGSIISLRKDGTTVGSIGTTGSNVVIGTGSVGLRFYDGGDAVIPHTAAGGSSNGLVDLGQGGFNAFKDLYLSGGVYLGGTGSANKLDDYEEGTFTPSLPDGATYTEQVGTYTKIGNVVHIEIRLGWSANGSTNDFKIDGLPFPPNGIPTFAVFNNGKTSIGSNKWNTETSNSTIYLRQSDATTGASSIVSLLLNDATTAFRITGSYKTNS